MHGLGGPGFFELDSPGGGVTMEFLLNWVVPWEMRILISGPSKNEIILQIIIKLLYNSFLV